MNYYYFAASLPTLALDGKPPFSRKGFAAQCRANLSPAHARAFAALTDDSIAAPHPFVKVWRELDAQIRNQVAALRAARRKVEAGPFLRPDVPFSADTAKAVSDAFALPNPLQRERAIDRFRWDQIERIQGFDMFSINAILGYAVKLQLVDRWASLSDERGRTRASDLIEQRSRADH